MAEDAGYAFPLHGIDGVIWEGMTLRDYFAAQALPAVIAAYVEANGRCIGADHTPGNCSIHAYRIADAMIRSRT